MMFSRSIASGAMLVLIITIVGGAAWQDRNEVPDARIAEVAMPEPETVDESPEAAERPVSAPERVVDAAGFPAIVVAEDKEAETEEPSPIVTVNGRPLGSEPVAAEPTTNKPSDATSGVGITESDRKTDVAVVAPPLPKPRPEGLAVRPPAPAIDYNAIAEAAYGGDTEDYLQVPPQQDVLAPMSGVYDFDRAEGNIPHDDELVGVVGPNGEVIWVYQEQVPTLNSRVTVQRSQPANPFGFVYD